MGRLLLGIIDLWVGDAGIFSEVVELLEAVPVDDAFQFAVRIVADEAMVVENHHFAIFACIRVPERQSYSIWVSCLCEVCPYAAHDVSEFQVFGRRIGEFVRRLVQSVEAELQFVSVNASVVDW